MNYEILEALGQIASEKNVSRDLVIETLEMGLLSAAKKRFGTADNIQVVIDQNTGEAKMFATKTVVEKVEDPSVEIPVEKAREIDSDVEIGSEVAEEIRLLDFGRNSIQTAKQMLVQRVREAEREKTYSDFQKRIGEIIQGNVQQVIKGDIIVSLGATEAIIISNEQIRKERYRQGDLIRCLIIDVDRTNKGPQIMLSRTHPDFLIRLFEMEVPEVYEGLVEIKAVAREPGERSKIAVHSTDDRIDPVGACVGIRGSRVQAIVRELSNERIDIIPWNSELRVFVAEALRPASVPKVIWKDGDERIVVIVEESQYSLAIGKSGQNVRLAAQLTGYGIDILTQSAYEERLKEERKEAGELTDLPGVGAKTSEKLKKANIETISDVSRFSASELAEIPGIGKSTADKIFEAAKSRVESNT